MKAYRRWLALLIALLLAGAALLWLGLHDYRVSFRLPRGRESAIQHCIAPQNLS